ncbi:MAG TPA: hypothetical protein VJ455_02420 [Ignavibacteria bacterium]|nr:hypothetical protein [Ignavibacteria bacterium]
MTNKEQVRRNIGLSFDFIRQIIKNPKLLDSVKNGSTIDFVDKDFVKIRKNSQKKKVKYFKVKPLFEEIK